MGIGDLHPYKIKLNYSKTECVNSIDEIEHPIVKEALKLTGVEGNIEMIYTADIPAKTGLGSSSSFAVCLLHALHAYKHEFVTREQLAREASYIEIELLKRPIGKQDHYAAAYGGLNYIQFNPDDSTSVEPVVCPPEVRDQLFENLMMFYTNITRDASTILSKQQEATAARFDTLRAMREITTEMQTILYTGVNLNKFGELLDKGWKAKRSLTSEISNELIDTYYQRALDAGALGGKLLGAGGGGFLLLYVEKQNQARVRRALGNLVELEFDYEPHGSKIIYTG
jgi:D-glycero-alpha-D-manno-heptose-7-phosphate kinase